ncbi:MAG: flavin reductase [Firmicutes bacterium]|nr:flavin reductase [Bacillota bacterium]
MLQKTNINQLSFNPFTMISDEWALVTASDESKANTMTVSWGGVGHIWGKNVVTVYIRQSRYTKEFVDANDTFTLTFFDESYKKTLGYLGTASGRDEDKIAKSGLTPVYDQGTVYFKEAKLVFVCRKLSETFLGADTFIDPTINDKIYSDKDYHSMYIAEIIEVLEDK